MEKNRFSAFFFYFCHLICLGIFLSSCTTTPQPPRSAGHASVLTGIPTPVATKIFEPIQTAYHEVGPMETLWRIAKEYDVDIKAIMDANGIRNPNQIKIGQKLEIPGTRGLRPVIPLYNVRPWTYIVIHHTATDIGNASSINRSHHQRGFWDGLGYHFLIDNGTLGKLDGQIEISPRWVKQKDGAHCNASGMNQNGIGIALVGNFSTDRVSKNQMDSLTFLVSTLMKHYQISIDHVLRHGDVPGKNTECPGKFFPWNEFLGRLRQVSR